MTQTDGTTARPYTRRIWALVAVAVLGSLRLIASATTMPAYEGTSSSGSSASPEIETVTHSTQTLVEANGYGVLLLMAAPLVVSVLVAIAVARSNAVTRVIAWAATGLLGIFTLLAMLTVGFFVVPVTGCLVAACAFDFARSRSTSGSRGSTVPGSGL